MGTVIEVDQFLSELGAAINKTRIDESEKAINLKECMMEAQLIKERRTQLMGTVLRVISGHDKKLLKSVHSALEKGFNIKALDETVDAILKKENFELFERKQRLAGITMKAPPPLWLLREYERLGRVEKLAPEEEQLRGLIKECLELFGGG
jgi:hypothetical protein